MVFRLERTEDQCISRYIIIDSMKHFDNEDWEHDYHHNQGFRNKVDEATHSYQEFLIKAK